MSPDTVNLVWDATSEKPTIGGALVLRQEGEILARMRGRSVLGVNIIGSECSRQAAYGLIRVAFDTSAYAWVRICETEITQWPLAHVRTQPEFSYFSFSRISALYAETGFKPHLRWHPSLLASALKLKRNFAGRLYCLHLRSTPPFLVEDSNADGVAWNAFLERHAVPGKCDFLLIGDDPLPAGLNLRPGVTRASDSKLFQNLATQLALSSICDGFLGMASGLCTAANFSETPHVIFKHPAHHPVEMARELGNAKAFPFAGKSQQLWRCEASETEIDEAFRLITS